MHKIESHLSLLTWFLPILICNLSQPSSETNYSQSYYTIIIKVVTLLLVCHCTDANWRRLFHYVDSLSEDWPSFELCFEISLGDQIEPVMVNLSKDHECVEVWDQLESILTRPRKSTLHKQIKIAILHIL